MSQPKTIRLLQLYPKDMNIYGDWGNTLVLARRLERHGFSPELIEYNVGDAFPDDIDIIVGGGGQDSGQNIIQNDLQRISSSLHKLADEGVPMLVICGLYQLFGHRFVTADHTDMPGIGLLDLETVAGPTRLIGNIVTESEEFGTIIGYENHSGQTTLGKNVRPLAEVRLGAGNNDHDGHEGARYKNIIGSYLHGSLLPKNPRIADWMIEQAATRKFGTFQPGIIDDTLTESARQIAMQRSR